MQMVGDLLDGQDLRLMSVLMCRALATVPSQKHIAFITTTLYSAKDWMLRHPKFCEWLLPAGLLPSSSSTNLSPDVPLLSPHAIHHIAHACLPMLGVLAAQVMGITLDICEMSPAR